MAQQGMNVGGNAAPAATEQTVKVSTIVFGEAPKEMPVKIGTTFQQVLQEAGFGEIQGDLRFNGQNVRPTDVVREAGNLQIEQRIQGGESVFQDIVITISE